MKKTYVKPEVYFEDFQLSANIAGNCGTISNAAAYVCPITVDVAGFGTVTAFQTKESGCSWTPPSNYDGICYQPPADSTRVFSS